MGYAFGKSSLKRMNGVHPLLVECAERTLSYGVMDLTVPQLGGIRTLEDQEKLVAKGASWTLNSLHRPQSTGFGHAIDLVPYPVDWDDLHRFAMMGALMFRASKEIGMPLEWGAFWSEDNRDYPHFQLPRGFKG